MIRDLILVSSCFFSGDWFYSGCSGPLSIGFCISLKTYQKKKETEPILNSGGEKCLLFNLKIPDIPESAISGIVRDGIPPRKSSHSHSLGAKAVKIKPTV